MNVRYHPDDIRSCFGFGRTSAPLATANFYPKRALDSPSDQGAFASFPTAKLGAPVGGFPHDELVANAVGREDERK